VFLRNTFKFFSPKKNIVGESKNVKIESRTVLIGVRLPSNHKAEIFNQSNHEQGNMAKNPFKVVHWSVSPFQLKSMTGAFSNVGKRVWLRTKNFLMDAGPAITFYSYLYWWFQKERKAFKIGERP
jgi:hypothetical protein